MIDRAAIRAKHVIEPRWSATLWCAGCGDDTWPCDAAALLAELARVEGESSLCEQAADRLTTEARERADQAEARLTAATEAADRLRAALEEYGEHLTSCAIRVGQTPDYSWPPCSCGLDAALPAHFVPPAREPGQTTHTED